MLKPFVFVFLAAAIFPRAPLAAQSNTGAFRGILKDSSGAVIPAATLTLTPAANGSAGNTTTDVNGGWSFLSVATGEYVIKVRYPGFEDFSKSILAQSGRTIDVPIELLLQTKNQAITVQGGGGPELTLDPAGDASTVSISGADLDALPDDPDDLTDMLTQLAGPGAGINGNGPQILMDGFSGGQLPAKAAIKEIKVNQNPLSAEYDWLGFGRIEIITKPGADSLRGTVGLTDSNALFNSRNPYAENKADYVNRIFTGNVAGPISKKSSYNLNFQRNTMDNTALINAVTIAPSTLAELPVRETVVTPRNDIDSSARFDDQLNTNNTLTGSYRYYLSNRDNNGIGQYSLLSRAYSSEVSRQELRLTETAILSTSVVNDTRFAWTRANTNQYGSTEKPSIIVTNAFNDGSAQVGAATNLNRQFELQNNTTVVHGAHTFRFGFRGRDAAINDVSPANFGGTFTFFGVTGAPVLNSQNQPVPGATTNITSLEQYRRTLIGAPGGGASQFSIATGNPLASINIADAGVYAMDDWRIRPGLNISAGLRYEAQTNLHDWSDVGPRLAIAWAPAASGSATPKVVIRAGAGLFYQRVGNNFFLNPARYNGTNQRQILVQNPTFFPDVPPVTSLAGTAQPITTYRLDPRMRAPSGLITVLTVERQLPGKTTVSGNWIHFHGTRFIETLNINTPEPGTYLPGSPLTGLRPYGAAAGNIFEYQSGGVINQDQMWVEVNNRLNKKVSITANYQISWSSDDFSSGPASNPYNIRQDYGPSAWNRRHNLSLLGTITGPWGLQFSPFFMAASGQPYDLTTGTDLYGTTIANARPAFATDPSRPSVVNTKFGTFDTNPIPGEKLVPRNYLQGTPMWNINMRLGRTFALGKLKNPAGEQRLKLNFNIDVNNVLNHLNQGSWVGNLSSPLFGQSTQINLFRDTSNNRRVQLGTAFNF
jgi:hypothetical protein